MTIPAAVLHISNHILGQINKSLSRPIFVAVQGPQGSGKSFLTDLVRSHLSASPYDLSVVVLSVDDLYLTHEGLVSLAQHYPDNPLWRGRGQPGTHDIELGLTVLNCLKQGTNSVELPRFDKSLFDGQGDRLPMDGSGIIVNRPVDVFIMEGWFMGFYPISPQELQTRWDGVWKQERRALNLDDSIVGTKDNISTVNAALSRYTELWSFFDVFIKLEAASSSLSTIYEWRLQQEHYMKAHNGGKGMTDAAVKLFVDRYIPGYVFFGDGIFKGAEGGATSASQPRWLGRSLRISIDETREVVSTEGF